MSFVEILFSGISKFINVTILCLPLILNGNLEYCLLARFDSQKSINLPFSIKDIVAKTVSRAKMVATKKYKGKVLATEIPQQRGRGRPKIVKANNKENKSYTESLLEMSEIC
jgi:hypothetical protein